MSDKKYIYALRLEDGRFYVGSSDTPRERIYKHTFNYGHSWTYWNKPISVLGIIGPFEQYHQIEHDLTVFFAGLFGAERVQGAEYTAVTPSNGFPQSVQEVPSPGWEPFAESFDEIPVWKFFDVDPGMKEQLSNRAEK